MPAAEPAGQLAAPFIRPIVREAATEATQLFVPPAQSLGTSHSTLPDPSDIGKPLDKPYHAAPRGPHIQGL